MYVLIWYFVLMSLLVNIHVVGIPKSHPCAKRVPCRNYGKCVPSKDGDRYTNDYTCECYDQYVEHAENDKVCDVEVDNCKVKNIKCQNGGECIPTWGNFYCHCPPNWGGIYCDETFDQERVDTPVFMFDPDAFTGHPHQFIMYLRGNITGNDLNFNMAFDNRVAFSSKTSWTKGSILSYVDLFASPTIRNILRNDGSQPVPYITFPYTFTSKNIDKTIYYTLMNGDVVQFRGSWKLRVIAEPSECVPNVFLRDCLKSNKNAGQIRRKDKLVIRGLATQDCPHLGTNLTYKWIFYNLKDIHLPIDDGQLKNTMTYDVKQTSYFQFIVLPFTLRDGLYAVRLQVEETGEMSDYTPKISCFNSAVCWFRVTSEPLVATIVGGVGRKVTNRRPLIMNGSLSFDPNEDEYHQGSLIYAWSCDVKDSSKPPSPCKGLDNFVFNGKVWRIATKELESIKKIIFQLRVTHSTKESTVKQDVTIKDGEAPDIEVRCLKNCAKDFKTNTEDEISFEVVCNYNCQGSDAPYFYYWKQDQGSPEIRWNWDTQTPRDSHMLIINPSVLDGEMLYVFKVTGRGEMYSEASVEIFTNRMPEKGTCSIDPQEGYESITSFHIKCSDFKDEDEWPLVYEYSQIQDSSEPEHSVLLNYDIRPETDVILSRGYDDNSQSTIKIQVSDIYGMFAVEKIKVQVKPMIWSSEDQKIDFMNKTIFGREKTFFLQNLLVGGDFSGAASIISTLCSLMATTDLSPTLEMRMKNQLVSALDKVPIHYFSDVVQVASTLHKVTDTDEMVLDYSLGRKILDLVDKVSRKLNDKTITKYTNTQLVREVAESWRGTC